MKDPAQMAKAVLDTPWNGDLVTLETFISNAFRQCQADTIDQCAGLVLHVGCLPDGSQAFPESIAAYLIAFALKVHPGHETDPHLLNTPCISPPSNEEAKSDTVVPQGVIKPGETLVCPSNGGCPPQTEYVPESPESST